MKSINEQQKNFFDRYEFVKGKILEMTAGRFSVEAEKIQDFDASLANYHLEFEALKKTKKDLGIKAVAPSKKKSCLIHNEGEHSTEECKLGHQVYEFFYRKNHGVSSPCTYGSRGFQRGSGSREWTSRASKRTRYSGRFNNRERR